MDELTDQKISERKLTLVQKGRKASIKYSASADEEFKSSQAKFNCNETIEHEFSAKDQEDMIEKAKKLAKAKEDVRD